MEKYLKAIDSYLKSSANRRSKEEIIKIMKMRNDGYKYCEIDKALNKTGSCYVYNSILRRAEGKVIEKKKPKKPCTLEDFLDNFASVLTRSNAIEYMTKHFELRYHDSKFIYEIWRKNFMKSHENDDSVAGDSSLNIDKNILCLQYKEKDSSNQGGA